MQWTSAPNIAGAPLPQWARGFWKAYVSTAFDRLERLLEAERAQLPPWFVVGFGAGIAAWFALGFPIQWAAFLCISSAIALGGFLLGGGRAGRALGWFALVMTLGCALVWARAALVAAPRLDRPVVASFDGKVEMVETLVARGTVRLTLAPTDPQLPPRVRVSIDAEAAPAQLASGATVQVRARLAPPPPMALPGTYDFARDAWFKRIGAVGKALGPIQIVQTSGGRGLEAVRQRLANHVHARLPGNEAGIAVALVTGDQNSVTEDDADAMRASGLWLCLWTSRVRLAGIVPFAIGGVAASLAPTPDLLVTGDGRHLVVLSKDGTPLLLRERAGDYMRSLFAEASGFSGDPPNLGEEPSSLCSHDSCTAAIRKGEVEWRLFATRSATLIDWAITTNACAQADIVVSDRRLPHACTPRWLKLDRAALAQTGGVAIYLRANPYAETVAERVAGHPWAEAPPSVRSTPRVRFPRDR